MMARIPTPVPKSLVKRTRRAFDGPLGDTLWKAGVSALFLTIAYILALAGPVGLLVGGIVLGSLLDDTVRSAVSDVWNRNFWVFRT